MNFLALDIGTSFIKGAVIDLDRLRIDHIRRQPFPDAVEGLPPLFYEVSTTTLIATFRTLLRELLALAPDAAGLVICSQMHCLVLCTEQGEARSNVITWRDERILSPHPSGQGTYHEYLLAQVSEQEHNQLGHELQQSRPLCYLYWLAQNGQLPSEPLIPAMFTDFLIAHLSGECPKIELTNAGAHGALNLETLDWHYPIIERLGLGGLRWPQIVPFGAAVGEIEIDGKRLTCYTPVGDHQAALAGAFLQTGELSLNISTGSQVSVITPSLQFGDYQTRPFFDGRFLNTITGVPAGRALNHLVNLLTEIPRLQGIELADPWRTLSEAAEAVPEGNVPGSDLEVNISFYKSIGGNRGHIHNMQEHNLTVGHLGRAAFQNMADNYWLAAQLLMPAGDWSRLVFSGGLAQKIPLLRRLIGQRFGEPAVRLCASAEDTLLGLMALALTASGRAASVNQAIEQLAGQE